MDDNDQDLPVVLETPEEPGTPEIPDDELTPEEIAELKRKAAERDEFEQKNKQLFERAKKAEEEAKKQPGDGENLPPADIIALSKVHEDDIERVLKFAKMEGISPRDALKNSELKAILAVRAEERATASAANVRNVRRGPAAPSDADLLQKAKAGQLPDSDEDIARLVEAKSKEK